MQETYVCAVASSVFSLGQQVISCFLKEGRLKKQNKDCKKHTNWVRNLVFRIYLCCYVYRFVLHGCFQLFALPCSTGLQFYVLCSILRSTVLAWITFTGREQNSSRLELLLGVLVPSFEIFWANEETKDHGDKRTTAPEDHSNLWRFDFFEET